MVILFDLDDTLVDSQSAHLLAIQHICQNHFKHENFDVQSWIPIRNKNLDLYFEGKISLEQHRLKSIVEFWNINDIDISEDEAEKAYQQYHSLLLQSCIVFPDVVPALNKLKNYQLGIISNGIYSDQISKLKYNKLYNHFKIIIVPEHVGFSKPAKEIFLFAAQKFNTSLSNCIYVGDSFEIDYKGSENAGMKSILLDRKNLYCNEKCSNKIYSLSDLKESISSCMIFE